MKTKSILAILAIFIIVGSMATVFAEDLSLANLKFATPDDFKVNQTNDTAIVLTDGHKTILVSTEITGNDSVNSYLTAQGFKFNDTTQGNTTVTGNELNGTFSFDENKYTKDKGLAVVYLLNKDNTPISVIGIDNDFDNDGFGGSSDIEKAVSEVAKEIMLHK